MDLNATAGSCTFLVCRRADALVALLHRIPEDIETAIEIWPT